MKFSITLIAVLLALVTHGQGSPVTGTISGVVMDETANEPMPFATVAIKGTTQGANTDFDGNFVIPGLNPGTYTLVVTFVGYQPIESTLEVLPGETVKVDLGLNANEVELAEVVVEAKANMESEMAILQIQRKSVDIKQSIGSDELSRKGVGDAEGAVTKITGVSKQEGVKNVFVRGLGDRYNSTSLNGLPLPSEDPEYKNINLGFFNTDIINSIDVNKTFGTALYGDVGGANIDIASKELFDDQELAISLSTGINSQVFGNDFTRISGTGYFGNSNVEPISDLGNYSFENSFDATSQPSPINSGLSIQGGKRYYLGDKILSTFFTGSMSSSYRSTDGINRSSLAANGGFGRDYTFSKYDYNANQSLLGNITLELGGNTVLKYNTVLIHNNTQGFGEYTGFAQNLSEDDGKSAFIRRQQVNDNTLLVNQILAEFDATDRISVDLGVGLNIVNGNEPDRRLNTFIRDDATNTYEVAAGSAGLNHRFFSELDEQEIVGRAVATYKMDDNEDSNNQIQLGYNIRSTDRDFLYRQFSFNIFGQRPRIDISNVDGVFNQASIDNGTMEIITNRGRVGNENALIPDTYAGKRNIHAGFVNATRQLSDKLIVSGGVRVELVNQEVTWDFNQDRRLFAGDNNTTIDKTYILPSLNFKYNLNEDNILRLAASKSYTMPQFKEVAPFLYEDIDFSSFGNPDLIPSDVYSLDLKFDHYFSRGELVSVTGFYKTITNSINRILVESAATEMSYVNSGDAQVMGMEVEARKTIWNINSDSYLDAGLNLSYLFTEQTLVDTDADGLQPRFTNSTSALEGASPLLVNADLTYTKEGPGVNLRSALVFNSFNDRIYTIGTSGVNDIVNVTVPRLDLITKVDLSDRLNLGVSFKNILNPSVERKSENATTGEDILISSYQNGQEISFTLGFKFY